LAGIGLYIVIDTWQMESGHDSLYLDIPKRDRKFLSEVLERLEEEGRSEVEE
jgi:hypothetical protein